MTQVTKLNQYLSQREAAKFLGISPITLRTWHKNRNGKIRTYTNPITGHTVYLQKDLEKFLQEIQNE